MRPVPVSPTSASAPPCSSSSTSATAAATFTSYRTPSSLNPDGKVKKVALSRRERQQTRETLNKLKELVPTVPKDQALSSVELLQHVIDYIFDLQTELRQPADTADEPFLYNGEEDQIEHSEDDTVNVSELLLQCMLNTGDGNNTPDQWRCITEFNVSVTGMKLGNDHSTVSLYIHFSSPIVLWHFLCVCAEMQLCWMMDSSKEETSPAQAAAAAAAAATSPLPPGSSPCYEWVSILAKLQQLVPSLRKIYVASEVEFLQHVIDYINDLQSQLNESEWSSDSSSDIYEP
ncbi:unnamed protein product [Soboliphyme baturini]|uniref:BHLH domain-containing protein n=1 Tax=Soboliphyme baturini TaxID=241478 RepID=A0A183IGX5_9BILA|nr:unnamed protein product [Soboliphyme baturini]